MINYWYQDPFVYRSSPEGYYEYFSYETRDWVTTYEVPVKELIHVPEDMAWDLINRALEITE